MSAAEPGVVRLVEASDRELAGGKAATLSRLMGAGFAVPAGIVVTTVAFRAWCKTGELPSLDSALDDGRYAVRSSAVGEDGEHASFAGQYESLLNVPGSEVGEAIEHCWSATRAATAYAERMGRDPGALAILIQRMIDADVAGVAFTANPVTGADEVVIDATLGLGDRLLDGEVDAERWVVADLARCDGEEAVVLTEAQAAELASVCRRIADVLRAPADVEWAFEGGRLFVLQARPITALPIEPTDRPPPNQSWERQDSHFRDPVLPLIASVWLPIHARCFERVAARAGLPFDTIRSRVYGGRVYGRLEPLGDGGRGRDDRKPPPPWVLSLLMRLSPTFRNRIDAARRAIAIDLPMQLIEEWEEAGRDAYDRTTRALLDVDCRSLSDAELARHIERVVDHAELGGDAHFMLSVISGASTLGALGRKLEEHAGATVSDVLDLVSGYAHASTTAGRALDELVRAIAGDDDSLRLLDEDPWALIETHEALASFIAERGHRVYGFALDRPMWAEDPMPLIRLLRGRLRGDVERIDPREHAANAEDRLRAQLREALWPEIEVLLDRARRARPYQDETEDLCFEAFGVFRYAALEVGRRLVDRGHIPRSDDVWFFTIDELLGTLVSGRCSADYVRRHGEYRWGLANDLGPSLGPPPQPPPDLSFPRDVDGYLNGLFWTLRYLDTGTVAETDADFVGIGCSPGSVRGPVKVVLRAEDLDRLECGDILVCPSTTASWSVAFPLVAGIITEAGGPLSHPATLAREYGIPAVTRVRGATEQLADGDLIRLDGAVGAVWLDN